MIRSIPTDFLAVLRDGFRIWWLAPLIPLLVVVPEALQHVAEIRIGMFESRADFAALANDPRRMTWGIVKVIGLLIAILATVRFWGMRENAQRWWDVRGIAWKNLLLGIALIALGAVPGLLLEYALG